MQLKRLIVFASAAALLCAGENWQKILSDSAWCKHAQGYMGTTDEDPHTYPAKGPSAHDIGLGGPANNDWFPVGKLPATKMPTLPVTVRWDSAQPVRQALVAAHAPDAIDTEHTLKTPEKYYIIAVIGLAAHQKNADGEQAHFEETRMRQGLLNESRLMFRGKAIHRAGRCARRSADRRNSFVFPERPPDHAGRQRGRFRNDLWLGARDSEVPVERYGVQGRVDDLACISLLRVRRTVVSIADDSERR